MEAKAWKEDYPEGCRYRLQIDGVSGRSMTKVQTLVHDWSVTGTGWNPETKTQVLLYFKDFQTEKEWLKWAKHFPYKLIELNRKGNPKSIKLGIDAINKNKNKR